MRSCSGQILRADSARTKAGRDLCKKALCPTLCPTCLDSQWRQLARANVDTVMGQIARTAPPCGAEDNGIPSQSGSSDLGRACAGSRFLWQAKSAGSVLPQSRGSQGAHREGKRQNMNPSNTCMSCLPHPPCPDGKQQTMALRNHVERQNIDPCNTCMSTCLLHPSCPDGKQRTMAPRNQVE